MKYLPLLSLFTFLSLSSVSQDSVKVEFRYSREPSFPGGQVGWSSFMNKVIDKHMDEFINDGKSGTCTIRFLVNEDGSVSEVKAITMEDSKIATEFIKAIIDGPKWIPGTYRGRIVKKYREVPIVFNLSNQ